MVAEDVSFVVIVLDEKIVRPLNAFSPLTKTAAPLASKDIPETVSSPIAALLSGAATAIKDVAANIAIIKHNAVTGRSK
jgi:hypothetical protein